MSTLMHTLHRDCDPAGAQEADAHDRRKPDPLVHYTAMTIEALQQQIAEQRELLKSANYALRYAIKAGEQWGMTLQPVRHVQAHIAAHLGPETPALELIPGVKAALDSLGVGK